MKSAAAVLAFLSSAWAFPKDCPNVTVIHDIEKDGWYGACLGLTLRPDSTTAEACKQQCWKDMDCSIWQMVNHKVTGKEACYSGTTATGCESRGNVKEHSTLDKFEHDVLGGQRIQHGAVTKKSDTTVQVLGLTHFQEKTGTDAEKMERCKMFCYTDVACAIWQYGEDGCWHETKAKPDEGKTNPDGSWTKTMQGGERIEHYCQGPWKPEEGLPWPWIITGIVLALLALGAVIYALQKKPKVKKTRAVKIEPKPEPQPVYFIPQPTVMIQVPQYQQSLIIR